jgi:hypothetical protein
MIRFLYRMIKNRMPMKKISTSCFSKFDHSFKAQHAESEVKPRRQTLDFLHQFARSYHVESSLDSDLCGFVMN